VIIHIFSVSKRESKKKLPWRFHGSLYFSLKNNLS
jgi:hypothetical protein